MRFSSGLSVAAFLSLSLYACGADAPVSGPDAGADAAVSLDAGIDARVVDGGADAAVGDAGQLPDAAADAALDDAALDDAALADAALDDAALDDAAVDDAAVDDAAVDDASAPDGGLLSDVVVTHPAEPPIAPASECTVTTATQLSCSGAHVTTCSTLDLSTAPPACGPHYGSWAAFTVYDAPVPWGYLLHAMEHGAVVIAYGCDSTSCPTLPAALRDFVDTYTADPLCSSSSARSRVILVPDPTLDVPIGIAAWGHIYRATCFDLASLRAFVDAHYAGAPEDFCADGVDLSLTGWCDVDAGV